MSRIFAYPDKNGSLYKWPPFFNEKNLRFSDAEIVKLKDVGFDFVRLSVDPGPYIYFDRYDDILYSELFDFINRLRRHGFVVIVDSHPATYSSNWKSNDILWNEIKFKSYLHYLSKIASRISDMDEGGVILQLMNEPQGECSASLIENDWRIKQKILFDELRKKWSNLPIAVSGTCWSSIDGLLLLDPRDFDKNTFYDFHFYDPYVFTHQSIIWTKSPISGIFGLSYPYNHGNKKSTLDSSRFEFENNERSRIGQISPLSFTEIESVVDKYYLIDKPELSYINSRFKKISDWSIRYSVPKRNIILGEFGAVKTTYTIADGSRRRWLYDVRTVAEKNHIAWALWDYGYLFGLLQAEQGKEYDMDTLISLGLISKD
ncbi:hypothetical protein BJN45_08225 [Azonexus hydrophilus]|uniref:Glycoside hydrolase family 5 domain-containing protein n=1 Tax=Azonexus hydrophilus TaxID=418702 RepID=A0A1R1I8M1_9RHOO|nr:hypothetical protein BJN45_08225 [Azonexus hydrophilus]